MNTKIAVFWVVAACFVGDGLQFLSGAVRRDKKGADGVARF
jgi:hypothetical protein